MPDIKDQHDALICAVISCFMVNAVVKVPDFAPQHIAALTPHPRATASGHHKWQVAYQAAVQQPGMRIDPSTRLEF